jgi:hypothetical protein
MEVLQFEADRMAVVLGNEMVRVVMDIDCGSRRLN